MEIPVAGRAHLPPEERRAVSRLHALLNLPGLVHGSLQVSRRRCGKRSCHCASGELHEGFSLRVMVDGRQRAVHVPADWVERMREWIERDREVRALLGELSALSVERLRDRESE
jgi:hypothetical protein